MQDKSLRVTIETSKVGIISTLMIPSGHPSTYSTLPTPSGAPFHAVPEDFVGPLDGCAVHFFAAAPDKVKGMGRCTASVRHGGSEVVFTITGEAEWLQEPHTEEELLAAFEVSLPNVPRAWLQRTAQAVRDRRAANELRVRCASSRRECRHTYGRTFQFGHRAARCLDFPEWCVAVAFELCVLEDGSLY